jgi:hypothetical protein
MERVIPQAENINLNDDNKKGTPSTLFGLI